MFQKFLRCTHKTSSSITSSYKTSSYQTSSYRTSSYRTSRLQNVQVSRRPFYKTSRHVRIGQGQVRLGRDIPNLTWPIPGVVSPYHRSNLSLHGHWTASRYPYALTRPIPGNAAFYPRTYPPVHDYEKPSGTKVAGTAQISSRKNLYCHFRAEIAKIGNHLTLNRTANLVFLITRFF